MSAGNLSNRIDTKSLKVRGSADLLDTLAVSGTTTLGALTANGAATFSSQVTFSVAPIIEGTAPLTTTSAGTPGQIIVQSGSAFIYVCTTSNSWARVALSATTAFN
jgi:hypothetical protein